MSGQHLVRHAGEAVEIAAPIEVRVRRRLLRAHIAGCPHRHPRLRQAVPLRRRDRPTDAKIRDQRVPAAQEDVLRLDVAVDDVMAMGEAQGVGDLAGDRERIVERELSLAEKPSTQRLTLDVRHSVVEGAAGLTAVVQRDDMRMVQACGDGNLPQESLGTECGGEHGIQDLESDGAIMLQVPGEEHGPHSPTPDLALDRVAVGQRRLEVIQQLGDQATPEKVPAYVRARMAQ